MPKFFMFYCALVIVAQGSALHYGYLWHDTNSAANYSSNSGYYGGNYGNSGGYYTGVGTSYHK